MHDCDPQTEPSEHLQSLLSRWENEGGHLEAASHFDHSDVPEVTNAELVHLRIRVIALENLMIAVLAEGSDRQLQVAREMAEYISPRRGAAEHPLTIQAARHLTDFVDRAVHYRTVQE